MEKKKMEKFSQKIVINWWIWGTLSSEGMSGANPMVSTWQSFHFKIMIEKPKLNFQKYDRGSAFSETSKTFISGWVGGWMGGCWSKRSFDFFFISIILISKMRYFEYRFQNYKSELLVIFYLIAVDNFWGQIWNQRILLVNILENEENRRTLLITTHPPTHPSGQ